MLGRGCRCDPTDDGGIGISGALQIQQALLGVCGGHAGEEAAGGLRVEQELIARIFRRHGSRTGRVASDVDVVINGRALTFAQSAGEYVGVVPGLAMGDTLRICVRYGGGSVCEAIQVPHAPAELQLEGGSWDVSGASAINRLSVSSKVRQVASNDFPLRQFRTELKRSLSKNCLAERLTATLILKP